MSPGGSNDRDELEVTADLLWALADENNRRVLQLFHEAGVKKATLEELSHYVAEHHSGLYADDPKNAAIRLHHKSLPQLAQHGVIEYDSERKLVHHCGDRTLPPDLLEQVLTLDED